MSMAIRNKLKIFKLKGGVPNYTLCNSLCSAFPVLKSQKCMLYAAFCALLYR